MRALAVGTLALLGTLNLVGCTSRKLEGPKWGPGAEAAREQRDHGVNDKTTKDAVANTFAVVEPKQVEIAPGNETKATVHIDRGKKFNEAVTLTFQPDGGLTVTPDKAEIKSGSSSAEVTVHAASSAKIGPHHVEVIAVPSSGEKTSVPWPVHVTKK
jgi:cytoskeletal protein RodZ